MTYSMLIIYLAAFFGGFLGSVVSSMVWRKSK